MTATTQRWADEMKESVEALKALRDEVKLKLHLANMDAKVKLEALEHRLTSVVESRARQTNAALLGTVLSLMAVLITVILTLR